MRTTISTFIAMFKHCIGPPLIRELIRTAQFPKRWLCKKSMWLPKWQSNIKLNIYHITEKCLFYFLNIQRLPYSHCFLYWLFKLIPWQRKKLRLPHSLVIVTSQLQLREGSLFRPLLANTKYKIRPFWFGNIMQRRINYTRAKPIIGMFQTGSSALTVQFSSCYVYWLLTA